MLLSFVLLCYKKCWRCLIVHKNLFQLALVRSFTGELFVAVSFGLLLKMLPCNAAELVALLLNFNIKMAT